MINTQSAIVDRFTGQESATNTPITEMVVNSLITSPEDGSKLKSGQPIPIKGVAWDGGYGIRLVEVSADNSKTWRAADLGKDYGRFGWRQWTYAFRPAKGGTHTVMARATNNVGQAQTFELIPNPAGYHHNLVNRISITVA